MIVLMKAFQTCLLISLMASAATLAIVLVKLILRNKLSASWQWALWLIVVIRLSIPYTFSSPVSISNIIDLSYALKSIEFVSMDMENWKTDNSNIVINSELSNEEELIRNDNSKQSLIQKSVNDNPVQQSQQNADYSQGNTNIQSKEYNGDSQTVSNKEIKNNEVNSSKMERFIYTYNTWHLLSLLWFSGALIFLIYKLVRAICFGMYVNNKSISINNKEATNLLERCKVKMHLNSKISIKQLKSLNTPAVCGIIKPKLLIPIEFFKDSNINTEYVFLHELAHIKRLDILLNYLIAVLGSIHWFNPIVWLAFRKMKQDRELACDEMVLKRLSAEARKDYGYTLLTVVRRNNERYPVSINAISESKRQIKKRIKKAVGFKKQTILWSMIAIILAVVIGCASLTSSLDNSEKDAHKKENQSDNEKIVSMDIDDIEGLSLILDDGTKFVNDEDILSVKIDNNSDNTSNITFITRPIFPKSMMCESFSIILNGEILAEGCARSMLSSYFKKSDIYLDSTFFSTKPITQLSLSIKGQYNNFINGIQKHFIDTDRYGGFGLYVISSGIELTDEVLQNHSKYSRDLNASIQPILTDNDIAWASMNKGNSFGTSIELRLEYNVIDEYLEKHGLKNNDGLQYIMLINGTPYWYGKMYNGSYNEFEQQLSGNSENYFAGNVEAYNGENILMLGEIDKYIDEGDLTNYNSVWSYFSSRYTGRQYEEGIAIYALDPNSYIDPEKTKEDYRVLETPLLADYGIVTVKAGIRYNGNECIMMDLVEGGIDRLIKRSNNVLDREAREVIVQIGDISFASFMNPGTELSYSGTAYGSAIYAEDDCLIITMEDNNEQNITIDMVIQALKSLGYIVQDESKVLYSADDYMNDFIQYAQIDNRFILPPQDSFGNIEQMSILINDEIVFTQTEYDEVLFSKSNNSNEVRLMFGDMINWLAKADITTNADAYSNYDDCVESNKTNIAVQLDYGDKYKFLVLLMDDMKTIRISPASKSEQWIQGVCPFFVDYVSLYLSDNYPETIKNYYPLLYAFRDVSSINIKCENVNGKLVDETLRDKDKVEELVKYLRLSRVGGGSRYHEKSLVTFNVTQEKDLYFLTNEGSLEIWYGNYNKTSDLFQGGMYDSNRLLSEALGKYFDCFVYTGLSEAIHPQLIWNKNPQ